ncbi:hypothetical protein J6590_077181 [Homalodisca vitripennis]|nr:hypothetical protein J6590_077181 [Homalodisca vitripennis]
MARFLTEGIYIWEMYWPPDNRSIHDVVDVATRRGLLYHIKKLLIRTSVQNSDKLIVQPIDFRFPRATATEDFEMTQILTKGFDVRKMYWPSDNRSRHAVTDVATRGGLCIR